MVNFDTQTLDDLNTKWNNEKEQLRRMQQEDSQDWFMKGYKIKGTVQTIIFAIIFVVCAIKLYQCFFSFNEERKQQV